jgi:hypothetical protein
VEEEAAKHSSSSELGPLPARNTASHLVNTQGGPVISSYNNLTHPLLPLLRGPTFVHTHTRHHCNNSLHTVLMSVEI